MLLRLYLRQFGHVLQVQEEELIQGAIQLYSRPPLPLGGISLRQVPELWVAKHPTLYPVTILLDVQGRGRGSRIG